MLLSAARVEDETGAGVEQHRCPGRSHQNHQELCAYAKCQPHCRDPDRSVADRTVRVSARSLELTRRPAVCAAEVSTSNRTLRSSTRSPMTPPRVVKSSPSPIV